MSKSREQDAALATSEEFANLRARVLRVQSLAANFRKAAAKARDAKGATIGRQWHEEEQARIFMEAAELIERALDGKTLW